MFPSLGPGFVIENYSSVDSTMDVARQRAAEGAPAGTVICAEEQRRGRGRLGRSWVSPPGAGLTLTAILRPPAREDRPLYLLSMVAGVAILRALEGLGASRIGLKWPNDLVVGERKLCGILLEAEGLGSRQPLVLVGLGLNLASRDELAGSLSQAPGLWERYIGLQELVRGAPGALRDRALAAVTESLAAAYDEWLRHGMRPILETWRSHDALLGAEVRAEVGTQVLEGRAVGVTELGALQVVAGDGRVHEVSCGEVIRVRRSHPA